MFRVGSQVEKSLADVDLTLAAAPISLLFPASHGHGLAFSLLLQVIQYRKNPSFDHSFNFASIKKKKF
jgi:hypothetical protein